MSKVAKTIAGLGLLAASFFLPATWPVWLIRTIKVTSAVLLASGSKKSIAPIASPEYGVELQLSGDPTAPRKICYGEAWTGGVLRFRGATGSSNEVLWMVIVLAGHECEAVTAVEADRELLTLDGSGNVTSPSKWADLMQIRFVLGTDSQTADSTLDTEFSEITSTDRFRGLCYAIVKLTFNEDELSSVPAFRFRVKGRKVYDPRLDSTNGGSGTHRLADPTTWEWSRNAVLCANDWMRGISINSILTAGPGISRFDWANVIAEANVCDESVALAAGGTQARYTADGFLDPRQEHEEIKRHFEVAMAGDIALSDEYWRFYAGAYRAPSLSLTQDHFVGPLRHVVHKGEAERYDTVQGTFASAAESGTVIDYAPLSLASAVAGEERVLDLELALVSDYTDTAGTYDGGARAQRIAKLELERQVAGKDISVTTSLYGYRAVVGESIQITHNTFGLTAQTMRVQDLQLRPVKVDDKVGLVVDLQLEAGPSSLYSWSAEETSLGASPSISNPQVPSAAAISGSVTPDFLQWVQAPDGGAYTPSDLYTDLVFEFHQGSPSAAATLPAYTLVSGLPPGTGFDLDPDTGVFSGTATSADTAASPLSIVVLRAGDGGDYQTMTVPLNVAAAAPAAALTYYVDPYTGDNANDGLSEGADWGSLAFADAVVYSASGEVVINARGGGTRVYRNDPWIPGSGGLDATKKIVLEPRDGDGDLYLRGPASGYIGNVIELRHDYLEVRKSASGEHVIVDGEAVATPGVDVTGHVGFGVLVTGNHCILDYGHIQTMGYRGLDQQGDYVEVTLWTKQHGSLLESGGNAHTGDTMTIRPVNGPTIVRGNRVSGETGEWRAGGHGVIRVVDGTGLAQSFRLRNIWDDIPGYGTNSYGYRPGAIVSTKHWGLDDFIIGGGGYDYGTTTGTAGFRIVEQGAYVTAHRGYFMGAKCEGLDIDRGPSRLHLSHCVFYRNDGPAIKCREPTLSEVRIKNCIFAQNNLSPSTSGLGSTAGSALFAVTTQTGYDSTSWTGWLFFEGGILIEAASLDDVYLYLPLSSTERSTFGIASNLQPLSWWITNFPSNFPASAFTAVPSIGWAAPDEDSDLGTFDADFAIASGTALDGGADLTTANGAGSSSTSLVVDDIDWFCSLLGMSAPPDGPMQSGSFFHLEGVGNVEFTAVNRSTKTFTLASAQTWSDGAAVNLPFVSGQTAPDCGYGRWAA